MAIERAPVQGVGEKPAASFSPNPSESTVTPPQDLIQVIQELKQPTLDALDSDPAFVLWAGGEDWQEDGIKQNLLGYPPRFKGREIAYFGTKRQGGAALFLKARIHRGEGLFFQLGHPNSHNEGGKRDIVKYWDERGRIYDLAELEPAERAEKIEKMRSFVKERLKPDPDS